MSDDLKPCPFCGEAPGQPVDATRILGVWNLVHRCKVLGPVEIQASTREDAITRWNTRAQGQPTSGDDREEIARLSQLRDALNTSAFVMDAVLEVYSDWEQWGVKLREDLDAILARAQGPGPDLVISDERARELIEAAHAAPTAKAKELMEGLRASTGPGEAVEAIIANVSDEDLRALASTYDVGKCRAVLRTVLRDALAATPTRDAR